MQVRGTLTDFLDHLPTVAVVARATRGFGADWLDASPCCWPCRSSSRS